MEPRNGDEVPGTRAPCCGGDTSSRDGASGTGASCGCGTAATGRRPVKTLLAVLVILAALGVGIYSLMAAPGSALAPAAP